MSESVSVASVIVQVIRLAAGARATTVIVWLTLTIPYLLADLMFEPELIMLAYLVLGLISLYLQLLLTSAALSCALPDYKFDPQKPTRGRFPSIFLLSLISLLAVAAGLLLLVVPGLILLARWSVSAPILLAEDLSVMDSLRRSWELTRPHWKQALIIALLCLALFVPAIFASLQYPDFGSPSLGLALATNGLFATASVLGWLLVTALYVLIIPAASPEGRSALAQA